MRSTISTGTMSSPRSSGAVQTGRPGRRCWTASSWPDGELVRGCMWNSRRTRPCPPGRVARTLAHQRTVIVSWGRSTLSGRLRSNTAPPRCRRPQRCGIAAYAVCSDRTLHYSDQGRRPWRSLRGARLTLSVLRMPRYEAVKSWQFLAAAFSRGRDRRLVSPTRVRAAGAVAIGCNRRLTAFGLLVGRLAALQVTAVIHPVVEHAHDKNA